MENKDTIFLTLHIVKRNIMRNITLAFVSKYAFKYKSFSW